MDDLAIPTPVSEESDAEAVALANAIVVARADAREVPHEEMRVWLLKIAEGDFQVPPPVPRLP